MFATFQRAGPRGGDERQGQRQAIHGREPPISGLNASGMERTRSSKNPPNMYRATPPIMPMPRLIDRVVSRTRARSAWRLAQLRQCIGHRSRKPKIEKSENSKEDQHDRHHAIARLADVAETDRNCHKRDCDSRYGRDEINDKIDLERPRRHTRPANRDI